jgi:hypothetical protein
MQPYVLAKNSVVLELNLPMDDLRPRDRYDDLSHKLAVENCNSSFVCASEANVFAFR